MVSRSRCAANVCPAGFNRKCGALWRLAQGCMSMPANHENDLYYTGQQNDAGENDVDDC